MNATQKRQTRGHRGQLPILIRYRAQDFETRYLEDPRILYIEEYHDLHRDDGFVAMIPREPTAKGISKWAVAAWSAAVLLGCVWLTQRLF